jgi:dTDP-L-rhamnose 4-epimerase
MSKTVLITGGAGFIGSHLADELLRHNYRVRALDALSPQVHGAGSSRPEYLDPGVELVVGDIRDPEVLTRALKGAEVVFHFAARVGVGQSMYELADYTSTNNGGTAHLLEALIKKPVERLIIASSMSVYGEGMYQDAQGRLVPGQERPLVQLRTRNWELRTEDEGILTPVATPETKTPSLASVYALSKFDQERMCLLVGRAYEIPTVALRFFNVYGTRQALSNPYTGVLAIFASRLLNDRAPMVFEDGHQQRDFVSVRDVVQACRLAAEVSPAAGRTFNVGSGAHFSVLEIAERMAAALGKEHIEPEITDKYRVGDIRHCFADITLARNILGYRPQVELDEGLAELAEWLEGQIAVDRVHEARAELNMRGLTV